MQKTKKLYALKLSIMLIEWTWTVSMTLSAVPLKGKPYILLMYALVKRIS